MEIQDYFKLIADIALELIFIFDDKGNILAANQEAERQLGYEEGELLSTNIQKILMGLVEITESGIKLNIDSNSSTDNFYGSVYRKNMTCFPADLRIRQIEHEPPFYVCMAMDVRERQGALKELDKTKREAEQAEKTKNEFVANVTHELRTPVNGILGHIRNLIEIEDRPEQRKTMAIIEHCCMDMNKLINNILDFSKLQADKFVLEEREFDFFEMMHHVEDIHSPKAIENGLTLQVTINENVPRRVVGDELRITQVLNNLISNAIKFTIAGKVAVEVIKTMQSQDEVELFFLVIDSGIGISETEKDKLFKSFSQVDASITRRYGGTGLGLVVCKELVELMRGSINVESEKGKGSMFSFSVIVKLPADSMTTEQGKVAETSILHIKENAYSIAGFGKVDAMYQYGTPENRRAIDESLKKLVLCLEMDNWEKAENFANNLKQLMEQADEEQKRKLFRLELAIRKENYDKAMNAYRTLKEIFAGGGIADGTGTAESGDT